VENGLTHGYKGRDSGVFELKCIRGRPALRMELFNDSVIADSTAVRTEGTGLKYVRSRLEESYPGLWSLSAGQTENGWKVVIEINKVNA
jgi:LytS/YehU family sensor histidine kinase